MTPYLREHRGDNQEPQARAGILSKLSALAFAAVSIIGGTPVVAGGEELKAAESAECKEITARLMEASGATFERYSPSGNNVFLKHPLSDMVLSCTNHFLTGVYLSFEGAFPPNPWFAVAAKA